MHNVCTILNTFATFVLVFINLSIEEQKTQTNVSIQKNKFDLIIDHHWGAKTNYYYHLKINHKMYNTQPYIYVFHLFSFKKISGSIMNKYVSMKKTIPVLSVWLLIKWHAFDKQMQWYSSNDQFDPVLKISVAIT